MDPFIIASPVIPSGNGIYPTPVASRISGSLSAPHQAHSASRHETKLLDVYVYDYLKKRNLADLAVQFSRATGLPRQPDGSVAVPLDLPGAGLLQEWWHVFWDFYEARTMQSTPSEVETFMNMMRQMTKVQLQNKQTRIEYEKRHATPTTTNDTTVDPFCALSDSVISDAGLRPATPTSPQSLLLQNSPQMPVSPVDHPDPKLDLLSKFLAVLGFAPVDFNSLPVNIRRQIILTIETQMKICNQNNLPIFSPQVINNVRQQVSILLSPEPIQYVQTASPQAFQNMPQPPPAAAPVKAQRRKRAKTQPRPLQDAIEVAATTAVGQTNLVQQMQKNQQLSHQSPNALSKSHTYPPAGLQSSTKSRSKSPVDKDPELAYLESLDPSVPIQMETPDPERKFIGSSYTLQRTQKSVLPKAALGSVRTDSDSGSPSTVDENKAFSFSDSSSSALALPEELEQDMMDEINSWLNI